MRRLIGVAAMVMAACLSVAAAGEAQERSGAGQETVAEWRVTAQVLGENYSVGFAVGVIAFKNILMWCTSPSSVGELRAFLLFGADPRWTLWQALAIDSNRRGCTFQPDEEHRKTLGLGEAR